MLTVKITVNRFLEDIPGKLFLIPPLLLITGFLLVPIGNLAVQGINAAVSAKSPLPPYFWSHLLDVTGNTFLLGGLTTVLSLLIALPLAFCLAKTDIFASRFWLALLTVPLISPPFIMAFATLLFYGRGGVVATLLHQFGIYMPNIFGLKGLVLTQLIVSIPYAAFILAAGLQGVPRHIEESAASMGAHPLRIWIDLVLPCIYPHLIISALMIFLMSVGDIGGPLVIGGGYSVISSEIYTSFLSLLNDERIALIFSLWIIFISFIMLVFVNLLLRFTVKQYRIGKNPVIYRLSVFRLPATILVFLIIFWLLLPFLIIFIHSLGDIWTYEFGPRIWSFEHYIEIIKTPSILRDTIYLALLVSPVLVIFALVLGHTMYIRRKLKSMKFIMIIPFVLPGVVLSVGVLQTYSKIFTSSHSIPFYALMVLTIIMRRLPFSLKTLEAGFLTADSRREEAAKSLGSSNMASFLMVTLPQIKPFVIAAVIIGLIKTATELSASLIMAPPDWQSLSLGVVYYIEQGQISRASAISIILVAVIGIGTFLAAYWSQRPAGKFVNNYKDPLEGLVLSRTPISFPRKRYKKKRLQFPLLKRREPLLIVDAGSGIVDANRPFLHLAGAVSLRYLQAETSFSALFFGDKQVLEIFASGESIENRPTSIMVLSGERVPVILNAYVLTSNDGDRKIMLYCRKVSGRARKIKEYNRLQERMISAEQKALKAQITPHFLFNSLNSVVQMIDSEPGEARDVVQNLADLYRYILSSTKKNFVPLEDEIESIRNYLAVEKARFGSRLYYEIDTKTIKADLWVPPMLLQPIVENAVNHGACENGDIIINIKVSHKGGEIIMRVTDHGTSLFDASSILTSGGTGLKNVEGRLFARYHRKISYEKRKGGGLIVTITIPEDKK